MTFADRDVCEQRISKSMRSRSQPCLRNAISEARRNLGHYYGSPELTLAKKQFNAMKILEVATCGLKVAISSANRTLQGNRLGSKQYLSACHQRLVNSLKVAEEMGTSMEVIHIGRVIARGIQTKNAVHDAISCGSIESLESAMDNVKKAGLQTQDASDILAKWRSVRAAISAVKPTGCVSKYKMVCRLADEAGYKCEELEKLRIASEIHIGQHVWIAAPIACGAIIKRLVPEKNGNTMVGVELERQLEHVEPDGGQVFDCVPGRGKIVRLGLIRLFPDSEECELDIDPRESTLRQKNDQNKRHNLSPKKSSKRDLQIAHFCVSGGCCPPRSPNLTLDAFDNFEDREQCDFSLPSPALLRHGAGSAWTRYCISNSMIDPDPAKQDVIEWEPGLNDTGDLHVGGSRQMSVSSRTNFIARSPRNLSSCRKSNSLVNASPRDPSKGQCGPFDVKRDAFTGKIVFESTDDATPRHKSCLNVSQPPAWQDDRTYESPRPRTKVSGGKSPPSRSRWSSPSAIASVKSMESFGNSGGGSKNGSSVWNDINNVTSRVFANSAPAVGTKWMENIGCQGSPAGREEGKPNRRAFSAGPTVNVYDCHKEKPEHPRVSCKQDGAESPKEPRARTNRLNVGKTSNTDGTDATVVDPRLVKLGEFV